MKRICALTTVAIAVTVSLGADPPTPPAPNGASALLEFLDHTIRWYGGLDAEARLADQQTDVLYVNDDRQLAKQVVTFSFEFARADAQLINDRSGAAASTAPSASAPYQKLTLNAASAGDAVKRDTAAIAALQQQRSTAKAADRDRLDASIALEQSRLRFDAARKNTLSSIVGFAAGAGNMGGDLLTQLSELEQTVPTGAAAAIASPARRPPPSGLVGFITEVVWLHQKSTSLQQASRSVDGLLLETHTFSAPLAATLREAIKQADQPVPPDMTDPATIRQRAEAIDAATARMSQLSTALVPLAKRRIALQAYQKSLARWSASVKEQYTEVVRGLLFRTIAIVVALFLVLGLSALWRRMTFRYVHDVRRRHQFLLLRRVVTLIAVAVVIAVSFSTDIGSLTTFAGLLTAGIAIAMQDVILSVAGYFVIISKYGIRVGDRVRIGAVTGEVLELGLVWMYLLELEASGGDQLPTGRIVEFPNAVVFDHSAGIFKQLPGTRFLWHEVSVVMPPDSDYQMTQQRMLQAVEGVFATYKDEIESQHRDMERHLRLSMEVPRPGARMRVAQNGVEVTIRYPVELSNAAEIDDRVTAAISEERRGDLSRPRKAS